MSSPDAPPSMASRMSCMGRKPSDAARMGRTSTAAPPGPPERRDVTGCAHAAPASLPAARRPRHDDLRGDVGAGRAPPAPSTSGRASPTRTVRPRWPRPPSPRSGPATTSTRRDPALEPLRQAIADHQAALLGPRRRSRHRGARHRGATEAIAATVLALCDPGDEVLAFEPVLRLLPSSGRDGRRPAPRRDARPPDHAADLDALDRARHRPDPPRAAQLAAQPHRQGVHRPRSSRPSPRLCVERDLIAVTDEVYEHLVFDGAHQPLATFPGMAERTLTISSAGKTFSFTGWKIGWAMRARRRWSPPCAPRSSSSPTSTARPFQPAVAVGLGLDDAFYAELRDTLQAKRDLLCDGLRGAGFDVFVPQGTYFVTVDIRSVGGDRRPRVLPVAPGAVRGRGRAERGLLRGPRHRPAPRPLRVLQARRGARRGRRTPRSPHLGSAHA